MKSMLDRITLPKAVSDTAAKTTFAVLEVVAYLPCTIEGLRHPFLKKLKALKAPCPVYDRFSHSIDEFVGWLVEMGWIARDNCERLTLTHHGKQQLQRLRADVKKMK